MVRFPPSTTMENRTAASQALPAYLTPITDGVTGCSITRIADKTAFSTSNNPLRHAYAKVQPWNADGSKLVLNFGSPHVTLNGNTYAILNADTGLPASFRWANTDPRYGYGVTSNRNLVIVDMIANNGATRTTVHDFGATFDELTIGEGEGNQSNDDRYWPLLGSEDSGSTYQMMVYDAVGDTITGSLTGLTHYDWFGMSHSGEYVVVNWGQEGSGAQQGTKAYDREMTLVTHLYDGLEHGDVGRNADGDDVYVCLSGGNIADAGLVAIRLRDGDVTTLIADPPDFYGGHVSCRNLLRPGWAYISSYGNDTDMPGIDEAQAIKLDGSGVVESFAMEHHTQPANTDTYQAHAVPNRDGSRVLFASDWEAGFTSTPSYAYVAEYAREDSIGPLGPF